METCQERVAIVTGAAGNGMGRSIALTLAREGASVVVNYRSSDESAQAIVACIAQQGGKAITVQANVFTAEGCRHLVETTLERFGCIDICIINPGGGWHPQPIDELVPAQAMGDIEQEIAPIYHLLPLVLPGMVERGWGRIIGIAQHPTKRSPAYAYNVGKAARTQALLLAADEAWPHGVTVNVMAPGPVAAIETLDTAVAQSQHGAAWQRREDVSPQDIAEGVTFLCSDAGRFVTGGVLPYLFSE